MNALKRISKRGRWSLVIAAAVAALAVGAVIASGAELETAELEGATNDVTVTQGSSANFNISLSAKVPSAIDKTITPTSPSTASVKTSYSLNSAGALSSSSFSAAQKFYASGESCGSKNCSVTWEGAPTPYSIPATIAADAATPVGAYTITLSEAAGTTLTVDPSGTAGGHLDDAEATTITVHVVAPPAPADTTAPTIKLVTPPDAATYPQGESVLAGYSCADEVGGSGLVSCVGDVADGVAIDTSTLGPHSFTVQAKDNAGNTASVTHDYTVVDVTPPSIECGEADGVWHAANVSILCTATDSGSGLKNLSDESFGLSTEVPNGTEDANASTGEHEVCDNAENCAVAGPIGGNKIDRKAPAVTCDPAPTFTLKQAGAQVSATVTDGGSEAAATPVSASADTSAVGLHTANITGSDNVGNTTTVACPYSVVYDWHGFFSPVNNNLNVLNVAKAGSAIPVKFSLSGNQGLSIFESGFPKSAQMPCDSAATLDGVEETVTAGGSSLSYDASIDQYAYVWKTEKAWAGTCRQLVVKLKDGTYHRANFKFTK